MKFTSLLSATALAGSFALAPAAQAQTTAPSTAPGTSSEDQNVGTQPARPNEAPDASPADSGTDVVVTGSRIRSPNIDSVLPITSIGAEDFFQQGSNNIGDTLNDLPQLRSTFAQQNPGLGVGIAGLNLLDLRGLGTSRTLVLVNGRRHVAGDILNNAVSPDVNTIPSDLIERVDIVTGGNSAVYGSDAIAGVVNFILKTDFDGLQVRGNAAVSETGYGANQYISALAGKNFADGRGNITVHAEYARQERVFASDIDFLRQQDGLGVVDVDTTGLTNGSDGVPDRTLIRDIRSASINRFGLVPITQNSNTAFGPAARCGIGLGSTNGAASSVGGLAYNCTYVFNSLGQLSPQTGTRYSTGIIGGIYGGNGQTGREDQLLSVLPYMQRFNTNLLAHYAFSDAAEVFVEAKFARIDTLGSNAGPSFIQGTFGQFDIRERVRLDNPFLSAADRSTIAAAIIASGCNTSLTASCSPTAANPLAGRTTTSGQGTGGPLSAADIAAINAGTYRFVDARQLADSGIRDEQFRRDTYRIVGGLRGTFNTDWNYEISGNYGEYIEDTTTYGYLDRQRFLLSLDAGRNPLTGAIQCRSQFDNVSAVAFAGQAAKLASDIAACVPYNPFGGADNTAAARYFVYNARHHAKLTQTDVTAFVGGDLSQLFELPGGPIRFVVGGEYRRDTARYYNDPFVESGATNAVVIGDFIPQAQDVKEVFGEVQVPILKDTPFFENLQISGAGRISDYGGVVGKVYAYNGGFEYAPIRDIRFRGNYGRSVRAPNVSETGFPLVPNFAPNFTDPCNVNNIASGQFRSANCTADLGALLPNVSTATQSLPIVSGSNPNLTEETADSYTVGAVIQPRWLPGFSLSVDYYYIKVNNVIATLSAQQIANLCYDSPSLNNQFCSQFTRFRGPGTGPLGELPGNILGNSLIAGPVNYAKRIREGVDVDFAYRRDLFGDVKLDTRVIYSHQFTNSNYQDPTLPNFENRILGELGDPQDEFRWDVNLGFGDISLGYEMRYISPMVVNLYEDFYALQDRPPQNEDYADVRKYKEVFYHDVRVDYRIKGKGPLGSNSDLLFFFGVDNVTNTKPPLGSTATGAGSAIYSIRGRNFFAGFKAKF